ncbi:MAG: response regulator [Thermoanaerobaculia bacterium]
MTDSPRRVLIVDDDAVFRNIVFQTLHVEGGYEVESVADALDAMEALQWRTYDAIVLDLRMGVFDGERMIDFLASRAESVGLF